MYSARVAALLLLATLQLLDLRAQSNPELLKTIDQLIEQNRRLTDQNQQLMEQIQTLRKVLGAAGSDTSTAAPASPPTQIPSAPTPRRRMRQVPVRTLS